MTEPPFIGDNPFPGLRPFEDDEAYLFFGRETQVDELLRRLRTERFIAVVGTSGSGKSSLVRAGLFSALRVGAMSGAGSRWKIAAMRPGNDPIGELALALDKAKLLGTGGDAELRIDLALAILDRGALGLVEIVRQMPIASDENVLIVVDQFEELFRYAQSEEGAAASFVKLLLEAAAYKGIRLYVVLTMRSDFLGDCAAFTDLPERINRGMYLVPRMTREQLEAAITGPVKVARAQMLPTLVNRLLNDVGDDPDQLPVLAHALMLTYDFWAADHGLREPVAERHYRATGGLAQAIDAHAERVYAALTPKQQVIAGKLFAAITELGSDNRGIRRPLVFSEVCAVCDGDKDDVRAIVDSYRSRAVSFLLPPPAVPLTDHTVIDISHEALMRGWSRLRRLLTDEVESARTYKRLADAAQLFASGKGTLLVDPALTISLDWRERFKPTAAWAQRYGGDFMATTSYLEGSAQERLRQRGARRAAARRRWTIAGAVIVVLALLSIASVTSFLNAQHERAISLIAQSKFLARDANAAIERGDAATGISLALEALPLNLARPDRPYVPAAARALEYGLNAAHEIHALATGSIGTQAIYSPDDKFVAVALVNTTARIYDARTDRVVSILRGHQGALNSVDYSPDGKRVVTASDDRTARIWDASTGNCRIVLRGHRRGVNSARFSKDGMYVVTSSYDRTVRIWSAHTGASVRVLRVPGGALFDAEFSPDGTHVVTSASNNVARVLDIGSGRQTTLLRHRNIVYSAAYSADGKYIATASRDRTSIIWETRRGSIVQTLRGHSSDIVSAQFSPDGKTLVTGSADKTARLWDVATGLELRILGHTSAVSAVYSHDGSKILSSDEKGTIHVWDTRTPWLERTLITSGWVMGVSYSRDGSLIGTGGFDGIGRIWNSRTGAIVQTLEPGSAYKIDFSPDGKHVVTSEGSKLRVWRMTTGKPILSMRSSGYLSGARYSPDGKRVLSYGEDGMAHLWDAATGARLVDYRGHTGSVTSGTFSPDGMRIATGSADTTARIWNISGGKSIAVLRGQGASVWEVAFSPDGRRLLTFDGAAHLWNTANGASMLTIPAGANDAAFGAFSPDGTEIVVRMFNDEVRLFDVNDGGQFAVFRGHSDVIYSLAFSRDGRHLVTGSADKTARIWSVPPRRRCQSLIDDARKAMPRPLTAAQRADEFLTKRSAPPLFNTFASAETCR